MLQQDFHRGSNPAYDKVAFVADHYDELVYMYQDILEKLKAGGSDETHQSSDGECLFETKEVTFIPFYIALNKDFFEDDTTKLEPSHSYGSGKTYNLTPKQMFGGTPEEIAKRLKGGGSRENPARTFSNAVYTETVSRTVTRYKYNPSTDSSYEVTETKKYYVFALNSPASVVGVMYKLTSNLYKYYQDNYLSEQLTYDGSSGYGGSSGNSAGSNMFFFILEKNLDVSSYESIICDCVDACKKYEDFTFTEVIPKGNVVMTYLGG